MKFPCSGVIFCEGDPRRLEQKGAEMRTRITTNAANTECKNQRQADAAKFAQDYKNFGQCVKSQKAATTDD